MVGSLVFCRNTNEMGPGLLGTEEGHRFFFWVTENARGGLKGFSVCFGGRSPGDTLEGGN